MHTDREDLERVPSFAEQERRARERAAAPSLDLSRSGAPRCDACGAELDPAALRFRCETCPPPPLPSVATELLARLRARREERS